MTKYLILLTASLCLIGTRNVAFAGSICDGVTNNLVANCGFETGDFTSWSLSGNDTPFENGNLYGVEGTDPLDGISPNSGSNQAYIGDLVANSTTLSQTLSTLAGDTYNISFYLAQDTAPAGNYSNALTVSFDGNTLDSETGVPVEGYTQYSYQALASTNSTVFSLTLGNDLGEFLLDDVVVGIPEPSTWVLLLSGCALAAFVKRRRAIATT